MQQYAAVCRTVLLNTAVYSSMPHLSRYYTLHVIVRGMRIWPPNAAKCCKNAGKFFPDVKLKPPFLPKKELKYIYRIIKRIRI